MWFERKKIWENIFFLKTSLFWESNIKMTGYMCYKSKNCNNNNNIIIKYRIILKYN